MHLRISGPGKLIRAARETLIISEQLLQNVALKQLSSKYHDKHVTYQLCVHACTYQLYVCLLGTFVICVQWHLLKTRWIGNLASSS